MKKFILFVLIIALVMIFVGCSEADRVNENLSKQAGYFECERRVTVYNARTDLVILTIEGYIDISNNLNSELIITCKTGANEYKKNYVYLNDYTLYVVEDITGTHIGNISFGEVDALLMSRFIINNKVYDTSKMMLVGHVHKWYETDNWLLQQMCDQKIGRLHDCELYRSKKNNYLLVHDDGAHFGEAIDEPQAKKLLMQYDYENYVKLFGELEEA